MSKKTLHIHIGSHKTATTTLQNTFAVSSDLLEHAGVLYPATGRKFQAHHPLAWQLRDTAQSGTSLEDLGDWPATLQEIDASSASQVIISSEDFEWLQDLSRLELLKDRYDVRVLFYIRSPERYLESYYNQLVKDFQTREARTLETYVAEQPLFFLDNLTILNRWSEVFGQTNIRVRLFDRKYLKGTVTEDFMDAIGCQSQIAFRVPDVSVLQKVSLPPDALEYLRLCNPHFTREAGHHSFVVKLVQMTQQHHLQLQQTRAGLLSLQAQHNVMRRFAGGNRQVARRYLGSDFVPFPPNQAKPHPDFENRMPVADAAVVAKVAAMIHSID